MADYAERSQRWVQFGQWVQTQRGRERTQEECADLAGISRKTWSRIENGVGGTKYDTIERILEGLQIPASDRRYAEAYRVAKFEPPETTYPDHEPGHGMEILHDRKPELTYEMSDEEKDDLIRFFEGYPPNLRRGAMKALQTLIESLPDPDEGQTFDKRPKD